MKKLLLTLALLVLLTVSAGAKNLAEGIIPFCTFERAGMNADVLTNGKTGADYNDATTYNFSVAERYRDAELVRQFGQGRTELDAEGKGTLGGGADGYIEVDFGSVCELTGYRVYNYKWGREYCMNKAWKLLVSEDGVHFAYVSSVTGNTVWQEYNEYSFEPVKARYVRLCALEVYVGGEIEAWHKVMLYELQLFGSGEPVKSPEPVKIGEADYINVSGELLRSRIVEHMKELCTVEWTPETDLKSVSPDTYGGYYIPVFYAGVTYHGMPYVQGSGGTLDMFESSLDENGVYRGPAGLNAFYGNFCSQSIFSAMTRYMHVSGNSPTHYNFDTIIEPLGGVSLYAPATKTTTGDIIKRYSDPQKIYEAYALLRPGDTIFRHPLSIHARLISDETHVERTATGAIVSDRSYTVCTEEGPFSYTVLPTGSSSPVKAAKDIDPRVLSGSYTLLYGSSCVVDKKYTFTYLIENDYLPATYKPYSENRVEAPVFEVRDLTNKSSIARRGIECYVKGNYATIKAEILINKGDGKLIYTDTFYPKAIVYSGATTGQSYMKLSEEQPAPPIF